MKNRKKIRLILLKELKIFKGEKTLIQIWNLPQQPHNFSAEKGGNADERRAADANNFSIHMENHKRNRKIIIHAK